MKNHIYLISIIITVSFVMYCNASEGVCSRNITETKYKDEVEEYIETEMVEVKCKRSFANLFKKKICQELRNVTKERTIQKPYEVLRTIKTCCTGYERRRNKCVPVCQQSCENARCTGPDVCTCKEGYTTFNTYRCVPACSNCEHGRCIAPEVCDCYSGYESVDGGCQPICDPPCEYGVCTEPNFCDYERTTSTTQKSEKLPESIEYPEETAQRSLDTDDESQVHVDFDYDDEDELHPVSTPKTTSTSELPSPSPFNPCIDGFALDSTGVCRLQCEIDCHYGTYEHGTCICNEGFRNSPANHCICEPHCDNECTNGLCTGNNTCLCDEGYNLNPEDNFICLDSNTCHCINGDCTDADHCSCWSGYELKYSERNYHRCEPLCGDPSNPEGCINGKCLAPFLCQCNEGFIHGPNNNFTCYANMNCEECIKNKMNCLPTCYTTTSISTESINQESEATTEMYDDYDQDILNGTITDDLDKREPILVVEEANNDKLILYVIITIGSIVLVAILVILILKRINKPIDYDVNQREHSENNVYFIKRQDDVKLNL